MLRMLAITSVAVLIIMLQMIRFAGATAFIDSKMFTIIRFAVRIMFMLIVLRKLIVELRMFVVTAIVETCLCAASAFDVLRPLVFPTSRPSSLKQLLDPA